MKTEFQFSKSRQIPLSSTTVSIPFKRVLHSLLHMLPNFLLDLSHAELQSITSLCSSIIKPPATFTFILQVSHLTPSYFFMRFTNAEEQFKNGKRPYSKTKERQRRKLSRSNKAQFPKNVCPVPLVFNLYHGNNPVLYPNTSKCSFLPLTLWLITRTQEVARVIVASSQLCPDRETYTQLPSGLWHTG